MKAVGAWGAALHSCSGLKDPDERPAEPLKLGGPSDGSVEVEAGVGTVDPDASAMSRDGGDVAQRADLPGPRLLWPLDCIPGETCGRMGYPDADGDGKTFDCGAPGYPGHEEIDTPSVSNACSRESTCTQPPMA
jgi:hypothetical protein